ncbi:MAG: TusE/DsrC/DsvC family sulfur relay protein [Moraxellaceae bacterium]|nr:MAG: TusE/DsrC/DsvC family sulfur relay protein [Moraxellaceae bacterium]
MNNTTSAHELLLDQDGHLQNYLDWTPDVAQLMAQKQGLTLTSEHLTILYAVQKFYQQFGYAPATRPLIKFLIKELGDQISNAQLMQDFQTGLVARTLSRLAGLPKPANCL